MRNTKPFQAWKRDSHMKFHRFQSHHLQDVEITRTTTTPPDTVTLSREEFEKIHAALDRACDFKTNRGQLKMMKEALAILNKHGGNNA